MNGAEDDGGQGDAPEGAAGRPDQQGLEHASEGEFLEDRRQSGHAQQDDDPLDAFTGCQEGRQGFEHVLCRFEPAFQCPTLGEEGAIQFVARHQQRATGHGSQNGQKENGSLAAAAARQALQCGAAPDEHRQPHRTAESDGLAAEVLEVKLPPAAVIRRKGDSRLRDNHTTEELIAQKEDDESGQEIAYEDEAQKNEGAADALDVVGGHGAESTPAGPCRRRSPRPGRGWRATRRGRPPSPA